MCTEHDTTMRTLNSKINHDAKFISMGVFICLLVKYWKADSLHNALYKGTRKRYSQPWKKSEQIGETFSIFQGHARSVNFKY